MCGIAGFVGFENEHLLQAMSTSLTHRGPDDEGFYTAPGVGLAMRRLSVIDLTTGHQPMANEDGSVHVVFNGEIYNYEELTEQLKQRGHRFSSSSDTETIVHLYEDFGLDFAKRLRGMFAIALWDEKRQRLVLVRDRLGEKPLYYAHTGDHLIFASEIKAILQREAARNVNSQAVCEFLALGYVPAPRTFYEGIQKLPPGHMAVYEAHELKTLPYWQACSNGPNNIPFKQAADQLSELLSDAVRLCLKSDVEVGVFLSGGIDSSLITALMLEHSARVQTFSVGFGGKAAGFNELRYARSVAEELGTKHHELILGPNSSLELLPRVLWHFDEPHGEPTSILVYLLSRFTKRRLKVALGGTGSDEVFYGYPRHVGIRLLEYYKRLPRFIRQALVERMLTRWPESTAGNRFAKRARRFVAGAELPASEAYLSWTSLLDRNVRESLLSHELRDHATDPTGEQFLRGYLTEPHDGELLDRAAKLDMGGYLPEFQLTYMDRMSMAHGLELRSPFCDYKLVDFVASLPASYRLRGLHSKHILKRIARRWIPRAIAERRKVGFDSPIGQWMKDELREFIVRFLSRENIKRSGLLDSDGVNRLLGDHLSGRRDYSLQLWSILALEAWFRMYIEDGITDGTDYTIKDLRGASTPSGVVHRLGQTQDQSAPRHTSRNGISGALGNCRRRWEVWESTPRFLRRTLGRTLTVFPSRTLLGKSFREWLSFAETSQWWDSDQIREYQLDQLRRICELAYERTRFYRHLFDASGFNPNDLRTLEDVARLPTIDKATVRERLRDMCTISPSSRGVDLVATAGTDGEPLRLYIGKDRSAIEYGYLVASWQRAGYRLGMPMAVLRGRVIPQQRNGIRHEYDPILRHHYYSSFHMTDEKMQRYLEHIRDIGPCFLHVYPSTASALARFLCRSEVEPPDNICGVITESEIVYPEQRRMVEEVLGCCYFSCYGHTEKLVATAECEYSSNDHVWPTYGYFELLDPQGRPVTTPGERGEIVGTGFINTVVPFIRYRTGDYATYVDDHCDACGRQHFVLRDIRGHRTQEVLITADGSRISWTALNMHDDTFVNVLQFQFRQDEPGRATLRIVPARTFSDRDHRRILARLAGKLDGRLAIDITTCDAIPLSPRGKATYVDQRIA